MILANIIVVDGFRNKKKLTVRVNDDEELRYSLRGIDTNTSFSLANLQCKGGLPDWADLTALSTIETVCEALADSVVQVHMVVFPPRLDAKAPLWQAKS